MTYLGNDAVKRVNVHSAVQALAQGAGGLFVFVTLLRLGVSVPGVLLSLAAILALRFVIRPLVLPLAIRFGIQPLLVAGTFGMAAQYFVLPYVHGANATLIVLCVTAAFADVLYWVAYHAYFAAVGDSEHRGKQVAAREAVVAVVGIVAPLVGAYAQLHFGVLNTFVAVGTVQALSALPLFGAANIPVKAQAPGALRASLFGACLAATEGWWRTGQDVIWQIALYRTLHDSLAAYGGALALAALAGAGGGLVIGRFIDAGHGRRALYLAYGLIGGALVLRAASLGSPTLAWFANATGALLIPLVEAVGSTASYNLAKAAPCSLRFSMATEAGWDVGGASTCVVAALIAANGLPLSFAMLLGLLGVAASALLLRRYYSALATSPQNAA